MKVCALLNTTLVLFVNEGHGMNKGLLIQFTFTFTVIPTMTRKHLSVGGGSFPSPPADPSFVPRLTLEKISKWTWLMLSSESEIRHSSVMLSPSRIGSVGPLMSRVAACGQRLKMWVIDHNMNRWGGGFSGGLG